MAQGRIERGDRGSTRGHGTGDRQTHLQYLRQTGTRGLGRRQPARTGGARLSGPGPLTRPEEVEQSPAAVDTYSAPLNIIQPSPNLFFEINSRRITGFWAHCAGIDLTNFSRFSWISEHPSTPLRMEWSRFTPVGRLNAPQGSQRSSMGRNARKRRSPLADRAMAASAALALGGGGLVWANFYASAHEGRTPTQNSTRPPPLRWPRSTARTSVSSSPTCRPARARGRRASWRRSTSRSPRPTSVWPTTRQAQARDASFVTERRSSAR